MSSIEELLQQYENGAQDLVTAVCQTGPENWSSHPVPGKWSIQQVVCHLADFEPIFADRMKRVLVEDNPTLFGGDPDVFAAGLHYDKRDVEQELQLIVLIRRQMSRILCNTDIEAFQRTGVHSEAGPLTLETILERSVRHITHHIPFIHEKTAALKAQRTP
ncbi:MAG: DinB family protein [Planctomycetaceae bacterium]